MPADLGGKLQSSLPLPDWQAVKGPRGKSEQFCAVLHHLLPFERSLNFVKSLPKYGKIEVALRERQVPLHPRKASACRRQHVLERVVRRYDGELAWQNWIGQSVKPLKAYLAR